jgi:hypothetical protein
MKTINTFINERGNFYDHMAGVKYGNVRAVADIYETFNKTINTLVNKGKDVCVIILSSGATNDKYVKTTLNTFIERANADKLDIYNIASPNYCNIVSSVDELLMQGPHIKLDEAFEIFDTNSDAEYDHCLLVYDGLNYGDIPEEYKKHVIAFSLYTEGYKTITMLDHDTDNLKFKTSVSTYFFPTKE